MRGGGRRARLRGNIQGACGLLGRSWKADPRFAAHPVEACAAVGDTLYFTYDGAVHRLGTAAAERVGALPPGEVRSLAAERVG